MDEPEHIIPDGTCIDCGRDLMDPTALLCAACQAENGPDTYPEEPEEDFDEVSIPPA